MAGPTPASDEGRTNRFLSPEVMRTLLDATPDALLIVDSVGIIVFANEQAEHLLGWPRNELEGEVLEILVPDGTAGQHPSLRAAFLRDRTTRTMGAGRELSCKRRDGSEFPAEISLSAIDDGSGSTLVLAAVRDITDRLAMKAASRRRENEARSAEQLLDEFASNIEVGFALRSLDPPEYQYLNAAYFRVFGFDPELGYPTPADVTALFHPDDVERLGTVIPNVEPGRQTRHEWRIIRPDGTQRWIGGTVTPIVDDDGVVRRVAGTFEDITDRKADDQARLEAQALLRELASSTEMGMFIRDSNQVLYANSSFYRILGLDPDSAPTGRMDLRSMIHPEDLDAATIAGEETEAGQRTTSIEMRIVRPDGDIRWVRVANSPVVSASGGAFRVATTVLDITERIHAEEAERSARLEAEQANSAKDEFLSRMSHELRTPLNAILGFAQLLKLDGHDNEALDEVMSAGRHLLGLVDEILDIAWMKAGSMRLSLEPVPVAELVAEAVGMLHPLAAERDIEIVNLAPLVSDDVYVHADRQRLKQVMVNLIANAVKYNHDHGTVRVLAEIRDGNHVRLTLIDNGIGIADDDQARLFQPFERFSDSSAMIEGTGLGLAVTHHLVTAMKGEMGVTSALGVGSEFWVELPIARAPVLLVPVEGPRVDAEAGSFTGPRSLLYIEDNTSNIRLMERILQLRPEVVLTVAESGRRGLELALATAPDLIMLDLHLPDLPGLDVLRRLRADPAHAATPIVMLSADARPTTSAQLIAAGATSFVSKPFDVEHLLGVIDRVGSPSPATTSTVDAMDRLAALDPDGPEADLPEADLPDEHADRLPEFLHDLANELGVIVMLCDLLVTPGAASGDPVDLDAIKSAADRAVALVSTFVAHVR